MLRHSKTSPARDEHELDALDEQLLAAVDAGLPKELVLAALPCGRAEALARLLRLVTLGIVEDDAAPARTEPAAYDDDPFDDQPTGLIETAEPTRSGVRSPIGASAGPQGGARSVPPALDDADRVILSQADALLARVSGWNLYELLNVPVDASRDTIRTSYATLARRFHPEAFQDKAIGEYRHKLELILATLTRAYGVLYDDQKRALYDAQIGVAKPQAPAPAQRVSAVFARSSAPPMRSMPPSPTVYGTSRAQDASLPAPETVRQVSVAPQRGSPGASMRPGVSPARSSADVRSSSPPRSDSAESLLRDVRAKRAVTVSHPPQASRASLPVSAPPRNYEGPLEALAHELSSGDPTARWAASGLREAHNLERRGEVASALALMQVIVSRYGDARVREQRDRLQSITRKESAGRSRELAVAAQQNKNFAEAAEHWKAVSEVDRKDSKAALEAAVCYMQAKELKSAGHYAKRAVELAPNSVLARRVLLRFYEAMGMELNATRERQALAKLSAT